MVVEEISPVGSGLWLYEPEVQDYQVKLVSCLGAQMQHQPENPGTSWQKEAQEKPGLWGACRATNMGHLGL